MPRITAKETRTAYQALAARFQREANALDDATLQEMAHKAIQTINTPLYATLAWSATASEEVAGAVHDILLHEASSVLLLNRLQETHDPTHLPLINELESYVLRHPHLDIPDGLYFSSIRDKLRVFWSIEEQMAHCMRNGKSIHDQEVQAFTKRKSTDVFAYGTLLRALVPSIPREVILGLYAQQLLRDAEDDQRDLAEDAKEKMPNPLLLRLYCAGLYTPSQKPSQEMLESLASLSGIIETHRAFVARYANRMMAYCPRKYGWIKDCAPPS